MKPSTAPSSSRVLFSPCPLSLGQSHRQNTGSQRGDQITPIASYDCRRDDRGWHYMRSERRDQVPAGPSARARRKCVGLEMRRAALRLAASKGAPLARSRLWLTEAPRRRLVAVPLPPQ
jgi:hypothetical protein